MELSGGIEQRAERFVARRSDVVRAARPAPGREHHRVDAVVAVNQLQRRVVADHGRHDLEVQISRQGLRLVGIEAVGETQGEDRDARIADREITDI